MLEMLQRYWKMDDAMNRRELLKSLAPLAGIPVIAKGLEVGKAFEIDAKKKYIVFIDPASVDLDAFLSTPGPLPVGTPIIPVMTSSNHTMDDAIRIYEVKE